MKLTFFLLLLITALCTCKIFNNCDLAKQLDKYGVPRKDIPIWVCIANKESSLNSNLYNPEYGTYGLFQVSQEYWCSPKGKKCNVKCKNLLDDNLADDIKCVKKIFATTKSETGNGFKAWNTYSECKNSAKNYVKRCKY